MPQILSSKNEAVTNVIIWFGLFVLRLAISGCVKSEGRKQRGRVGWRQIKGWDER